MNMFYLYITKLYFTGLIVTYRTIDHEFCNQFFLALVTLKTALSEWRMYSINNVVELAFCHLQKLVLMNIFNVFEVGSFTFQIQFYGRCL